MTAAGLSVGTKSTLSTRTGVQFMGQTGMPGDRQDAEQGQVWVSALAAQLQVKAPVPAQERMCPRFHPSPKYVCLHQRCTCDISVRYKCPLALCTSGKISSRRQKCYWPLGGKWELLPWLPATVLSVIEEHSLTTSMEVRLGKTPRAFLLQPWGQEFKSQGARRGQAGGSWLGKRTGTWVFAACFLPQLWLSFVLG